MDVTDDLVATWIEAFTSVAVGWDFSNLTDSMNEPEPPWDFDRLCVDALGATEVALDMGTGGGEQLTRLVARLGDPRPTMMATEGWPPNVPVATANLAPYGIPVRVYDAETDVRMPFVDECFSLVVNRHEAYSPVELRRVLRPGGIFLTQQVGSLDARETADWFGERPREEWTLHRASTQLEQVGFDIGDVGDIDACGDFLSAYRFDSVTTLLRYFALVPWDLPDDFSVVGQLPALTRLHRGAEAGDPIELTLHRWYLVARRPT